MAKHTTAEWELFEEECLNYLSNNFSNNCITFNRKGSTDSTELDLSILKGNLEVGKIEVKMPSSQAGQIVVLIKENKFIYSNSSKSPYDLYIDTIINHLNNNFKHYFEVGSKGIPIQLDSEIFYSRIINYYKVYKQCDYFITGNLENHCKAIFKTEDLKEYFDIKCLLRRKRSGTTSLSNKHLEKYYDFIKNTLEKESIKVINQMKEGAKTLINLDKSLNKEQQYINCGDFDIYLSPQKHQENTYQLKKRSNTNNPNIMFELILNKKLLSNEGEEGFKRFLNQIQSKKA